MMSGTHPRLPQMTSLGSGAAVAIQAVLSWCTMDVDATACAVYALLSLKDTLFCCEHWLHAGACHEVTCMQASYAATSHNVEYNLEEDRL